MNDRIVQHEDGQAVVLLSGGQDSTTCLAWAAYRWGPDNLFPVSIYYGQRHKIELDCAHAVCETLGVREPRVLSLEILRDLGGAALTDERVVVDTDATGTGNVFAEEHDLPSTFVPGRNLLFFTSAIAFGARHGVYNLVTGVCEADAAGYPDCRGEFVDAAQDALRAALDESRVLIHAPLLERSKAETFLLAEELGVLDTIIEQTHTCYHGNHDTKHDWGYGCGACGACEERANGWLQYRNMSSVLD